MAKNFIQEGKTLDYTNATGADIAAGDPVAVNNQVGVAINDILDTESGPIAMDGVWEVPKVSGTAINAGEPVVFDVSNAAFDHMGMTPAASSGWSTPRFPVRARSCNPMADDVSLQLGGDVTAFQQALRQAEAQLISSARRMDRAVRAASEVKFTSDQLDACLISWGGGKPGIAG